MGDCDEENGLESMASTSETFMVGFVIVNIVGLKHYTGTINGREMVGLVREPLNPYDPNAIKVLNMRGQQVGYIERDSAKVLSPLIDESFITAEGIVPRGLRNVYKMPCQVHIFARFELMEAVRLQILESGLEFISSTDAGFSLSKSVVVQERSKGEHSRSIDEIFSSMETEKKVRMIEPSETIVSELFPHQKEGLGWLVHRENSSELPPFWEEREIGGKKIFFNVLTNYQTYDRPEPIRGGIFADDMGLGKTVTLLALIAINKPGSVVVPNFINADSELAGSSETVNINSDQVHCSTKNTNPNLNSELDGSSEVVTTKSKKVNSRRKNSISDPNSELDPGSRSVGKKSKRTNNLKENSNSNSRKKRKNDSGAVKEFTDNVVYEGPSLSGPKTTLVVCPPSVISTWISQLEEHTKHGSLKVYLYHGERTNKAKELRKFDLVLTTYSTLAAEFDCPDSPIKEIEWLRVILDEAHLVKNASAKQSKAAIALNAKRRWAVTGTPIQNNSFDLFSLMAFLRFQPFSIKSYWQSLMQRSLGQGSSSGLMRLRALMGTISLRRTKDVQDDRKSLVGLPPKTVEIHFVELSAEERMLYEQMETNAKNVVSEYIDSGSAVRNYSTVLHIILRLRQICDDSTLCPSDITRLLPSNDFSDLSTNPELLNQVLARLQEEEWHDLDCPICLSPIADAHPTITRCTHLFCRPCILTSLRHHPTNPRCPICRTPLSNSDLFSLPQPPQAPPPDPSVTKNLSSKTATLIKLLVSSRPNNPSGKSVVFSQFTSMLNRLVGPIREAGFEVMRLDGTMSAKKRVAVVREFGLSGSGSHGGGVVLLASLKAGGVGVSLVSASRVYMMEPWWNPAVEEQAMDRVHRIGQREKVVVVKLVVRGSVEERMVELQEKKRRVAKGAFELEGKKTKQGITLEDMQAIMRL
ncbi:hypothetical protein AMTRI_Chr01g127380 [Amborella trichopoda]